MQLTTFWCVEGLHFFEEHDPGGRRRTHDVAICKECTKEIMKEFFRSSDDLRISRIYEQIVDEREKKRKWFKRRKNAKEEGKEKPQTQGAQGTAGGSSEAKRTAASTAGRQNYGPRKKDGEARPDAVEPRRRFQPANNKTSGGADISRRDIGSSEEAETTTVATDGRPSD